MGKNSGESNPSKATSDIKSGAKSRAEFLDHLGGLPPKKSVEEINKANSPKKAPGSVAT